MKNSILTSTIGSTKLNFIRYENTIYSKKLLLFSLFETYYNNIIHDFHWKSVGNQITVLKKGRSEYCKR